MDTVSEVNEADKEIRVAESTPEKKTELNTTRSKKKKKKGRRKEENRTEASDAGDEGSTGEEG